MPNCRELQSAFPALEQALPRLQLARLPTPVRPLTLTHAHGTHTVIVKQDNLSASLYGGNKVRKLEYLLARGLARNRQTVATFGAVGSHHALATALYAQQLGLPTIAFLSHQTRTPHVAATLDMHLRIGTTLVPFGGSYAERIAVLRSHLRGRRAMVIPMGGSSWLGTVAFIDAALEVAAQIARGECPQPDRVYVATGTMGTAVGLALGFALCDLPIAVHAVRITPASMTDEAKLRRLAGKTAYMLNRLDSSFPRDLANNMNLKLRHEFYGAGYAHTNRGTERAIEVAARDLDLLLEATYTGKAMAAMLHDLEFAENTGMTAMFWQSYHAAPLPVTGKPPDESRLPGEFARYFS